MTNCEGVFRERGTGAMDSGFRRNDGLIEGIARKGAVRLSSE